MRPAAGGFGKGRRLPDTYSGSWGERLERRSLENRLHAARIVMLPLQHAASEIQDIDWELSPDE